MQLNLILFSGAQLLIKLDFFLEQNEDPIAPINIDRDKKRVF